MKETNLDFYVIIPNKKEVSILLGLFPNVTEQVIKTMPKEGNKAIVIPVINEQILTNANHLDSASLKYLDSILSYLINFSYKLLTRNNIKVNQKILLNNHTSYTNFNTKYIEKYQGRVELYDLTPKKNPNTPIFEPLREQPIQEFKPVEPPFNNNNPTPNKDTDTLEELVEPILYDEPVITSPEKQDSKEPGFVSYVLLGVLLAIISLVFLYMIL
jgi:hypothetical protein